MITMTSLITICYHTKSLQHWDRAVLNKTYSLKKKINQKIEVMRKAKSDLLHFIKINKFCFSKTLLRE